MVLNNNLSELVSATLSKLEKSRYSQKTIDPFKWTYGTLRRFCAKNHIEYYDESIGEQFLDSYRNRQIPISKGAFTKYCRHIRQLDCTFTDTNWNPCKAGRVPVEYVSSCYDEIVERYEAYLCQSGKARHDARTQVHIIARFLNFTQQRNRLTLNDLIATDIYAAFQESTSKSNFRRSVGAFLRYAYKYKLINANLSHVMPSVVRHQSVPSVYSANEIEHLLNSIDRTTNIGKRDYAMLLIAARLGLRASDIAGMTFNNLNLTNPTIKIVQAKTKRPLALPLLDEVNAALSDYIKNARPASDDEHIFLNVDGFRAIRSATVGQATRRAFINSGIDCGKRKRGSHSLRASLATALLDEGNDYTVIQQVLGHSNLQSTKFYVKANVEKLRINALPVPSPVGNFKNLISGGYGQ